MAGPGGGLAIKAVAVKWRRFFKVLLGLGRSNGGRETAMGRCKSFTHRDSATNGRQIKYGGSPSQDLRD